MTEPAVAEIRATEAERRKVHAVRSLVGKPTAKVKVSVDDEIRATPGPPRSRAADGRGDARKTATR